jgi:hypothetical protein
MSKDKPQYTEQQLYGIGGQPQVWAARVSAF